MGMSLMRKLSLGTFFFGTIFVVFGLFWGTSKTLMTSKMRNNLAQRIGGPGLHFNGTVYRESFRTAAPSIRTSSMGNPLTMPRAPLEQLSSPQGWVGEVRDRGRLTTSGEYTTFGESKSLSRDVEGAYSPMNQSRGDRNGVGSWKEGFGGQSKIFLLPSGVGADMETPSEEVCKRYEEAEDPWPFYKVCPRM